MNQRRQAVFKLKVLMDTYLAEVTASVVDTLYRLAVPQDRP